MIYKIRDNISNAISNLYTISQINLRYLSESERILIINQYSNIIDGIYTEVCSEFDESLINMTKASDIALKKLKTMIDDVKNHNKNNPNYDYDVKIPKYSIQFKELKKYYNEKISQVNIKELEERSLLEMYLMDVRNIINNIDSDILLTNYDIYSVDDLINTLPNLNLLNDGDMVQNNQVITYLLKLYKEYSDIVKLNKSITEFTYEKLTEYKKYIQRDVNHKIKSGQCYTIECCMIGMYGILFFSRSYILTENIFRIYLGIINEIVHQLSLHDFIKG